MFYSSGRCNSGVISFLIDSGYFCVECRGLPGGKSAGVQSDCSLRACRDLPRRATYFSLLRQRNLRKRKATRSLGPYADASGNLRCSKSAEFLETCLLCSLRTSKNLFPLPSALLSPARTGWGKEVKVKADSACKRFALAGFPNPNASPQPVLAGLEKVKSDGLKNLDVRRRQSRLVSKFSGTFNFFKEPRSGPGCGSPFLCLLSFGEAKESELPPGNPRHSSQSTKLQKRRALWQQEATK